MFTRTLSAVLGVLVFAGCESPEVKARKRAAKDAPLVEKYVRSFYTLSSRDEAVFAECVSATNARDTAKVAKATAAYEAFADSVVKALGALAVPAVGDTAMLRKMSDGAAKYVKAVRARRALAGVMRDYTADPSPENGRALATGMDETEGADIGWNDLFAVVLEHYDLSMEDVKAP